MSMAVRRIAIVAGMLCLALEAPPDAEAINTRGEISRGAPAAPYRALTSSEHRGRLAIAVTGVTPAVGYLLVGLYDQADDFPAAGRQRLLTVVRASANSRAVFDNLPYGQYAVAVIYDRNGNGRLDMRLGLVPKERRGFSNNPAPRFGPVDFKDSAFLLSQANQTIEIVVRARPNL